MIGIRVFFGVLIMLVGAVASADDPEYDAWRAEATVVSRCKDPQRLARFLHQAVVDEYSAERSEGNIDVIDEIITSNAACFLRALKRLSISDCQALMSHFVQASEMHDQAEIDQALEATRIRKAGCYTG